MKSLFDSDTHREVLRRIHQLDAQKQAKWGTMDVVKMLRHSQRPLEVANGTLVLKKPNPVMKLLFKVFKSTMYNDTPWKKSMPTAKEFLVSDTDDFVTEKQRLIDQLNTFVKKSTNLHWPEHPAFGKFKTDQWGKMQYKHIDHHLRQFGV
ncbi:MAG: DUF1569 domain-containing protein [Aquaticitalea sp.]